MKDSCRNCRFWRCLTEEILEDSEGECRRYPPILIEDKSSIAYKKYDSHSSEFPMTSEYEWCGEFKEIMLEK